MKTNPVAGNAKPRHKKLTKREKRLAARVSDYEKTISNPKIDALAYHRPGSLQ